MIKQRKSFNKCNTIFIKNMQRISKEKQIRLRKRKVEKRERKERVKKVDFNYNLILTKWKKSKNFKTFIKNKLKIQIPNNFLILLN